MKDFVIKNAVQSFSEKWSFTSEELNKEFENFLEDVVFELKMEAPELYLELTENTCTKKQSALLEQRLELEFFDIPSMITEISKDINSAYLNSLKLNDINSHLVDYSNKNIQECIFEDFLGFLQEGNVWEKTKKYGREFAVNLIEEWKENFKGILVKILSIGAVYCSIPKMAASLTDFGLTAVVLTFLNLCAHYLGKQSMGINVMQEQTKMLFGITELLRSIGDILKTSTEKIKFRYMLAYKNETRCYDRAGIDMRDIGHRIFWGIREQDLIRTIIGTKTANKLDTLNTCFLEGFLDRIAVFFELYFGIKILDLLRLKPFVLNVLWMYACTIELFRMPFM